MALAVEVQVATDAPGVPDEPRLRHWAEAAWQGRPGNADVVLRITGEDESRNLNHEFRGSDRPTNVLSFPFEPIAELDLHHVGDIVICAPVVAREAAEQDKAVEAHWAHMVVHGMLHLQGYDHQDAQQAHAMESLETEILTGMGFPAPYTDEMT